MTSVLAVVVNCFLCVCQMCMQSFSSHLFHPQHSLNNCFGPSFFTVLSFCTDFRHPKLGLGVDHMAEPEPPHDDIEIESTTKQLASNRLDQID